MAQRRHADGVVATPHDGGVLSQLLYLLELFCGVARGAAHERCARAFDIGGNGGQGAGIGKIDNHVGGGSRGQRVRVKADLRLDVKKRFAGCVRHGLGGCLDERAHTACPHDDGAKQ